MAAAITLDPIGFLRRLRTSRGLYFLGAGASAGEAPLGPSFLLETPITFLRHAHSLSATQPEHSPLNQLLLCASAKLSAFDIHRRTLRPSTEDYTQQRLLHMRPGFSRSHMTHRLAVPSYQRRASHNYLAFRLAPQSLFMNYNHDNLAANVIGDIHRVIAVHGSVDPLIGSPQALNFILTAGIEYGLAYASDQLLFLEPECYSDNDLADRLLPMARFKPEFIAIIGYSFCWTGERHNDAVSLDYLIDRYRMYSGALYIVDRDPSRLQAILQDRLPFADVIGLAAHWNLLAHAFLEAVAGRLHGRSIRDRCSELLDLGHDDTAFPIYQTGKE